jgi:hypothetical protein
MLSVRAISPEGDNTRQAKVIFEDYDAAMAALRLTPRRQSRKRPPTSRVSSLAFKSGLLAMLRRLFRRA